MLNTYVQPLARVYKEVRVPRERELTTGTCPSLGIGFLPPELELRIGLPARKSSATGKTLHFKWKTAIEDCSLVVR